MPAEVHIPMNAQAHVHRDDGGVSEWIGKTPDPSGPMVLDRDGRILNADGPVAVNGITYPRLITYDISAEDALLAQTRASALGIPLRDYR